MNIHKKDVIRMLERIALFLEIKGENPFRISAYRRAAQSLERDERSLSEIDDFTKIKGIGQGTNAIIKEFIETGVSETLRELEKEIPETLLSLLNIPGLGGKRIATLYQELGIKDIPSLKKACENGDIETLPGFGKKTVENILLAIEEYSKQPERFPIGMMLPFAEQIETYLSTLTNVETYSRAGSLRRMQETIGDLDFIIATNQPEQVRKQLLKMDNIKKVIAQGDTKVSILLEDEYDVQVDFRLVKREEFATTLHHFTGSKEHNIAMRQLAKQRGEKINEYGIEVESNGEVLHFDDEKAFFKHFNLNYMPPEIRENNGEVEAFKENVPLIHLNDIRGDLHLHTTWSDGAQSIEEMVQAARNKGYEYMAITDHSKFLQVANGLNEKRLRRQREIIDELNEKYDDIHIFTGVEMDILPDGRLDFEDDFLKEMDLAIAAIHSGFNQSEQQIMNRLIQAMENPYVNIIAHPTGRLIGRRDGYLVDMELLIQKARETNTILEINANPHRFDLSAKWAKKAQDEGVKLAINTDAHSAETLSYMSYGISVGIKGWLRKESVINTLSKTELQKFLRVKR